MTHEPWDRSPTLGLIGNAFSDLADLVRSEIRLASAELSERLSATIRAGVMLAIAGVLGFVGLLILAAGVVLVIATTGLALFWSCFIVGGVLAIAAMVLALVAKAKIGLAPQRAMEQAGRTIRAAREQMK